MTVTVGEKVYYAGKGPYLVAEVVTKVVCGASAQFYRFVLLDQSGDEFLVPIGNVSLLPLRALTSVNKIPELLRRLRTRSGPTLELSTWRERESIRSKVFTSGSAFELGDFIELLVRSSGVRKLAIDEWEAMRRARKLLISEIAAVVGESLTAAEARIEDVLNPGHAVIAKPANKLIFSRRTESRR